MFDNLRNDANSFYDDDKVQNKPATGAIAPAARAKSKRFLGMTAQQRFIIATMMMMSICILGIMLLLVAGKIGL